VRGLLLVAALTAATPASPGLRAAWLRADPVDLARAANRVGVRGLAADIARGGRVEALAALAAASYAEEAWALLEPIARRAATDPDRTVAATAARVGVTLVHAWPREALEASGAPVDELAGAAATFAAIATHVGVWPDVRVHALEAALALAEALGGDAPEAARGLPAALFDDADAELRRAAVAFADPAVHAAALATIAAKDADVAVAAAAAAALCRDGVALALETRTRAVALAKDGLVDPGDASSLRRCLR
jgi:hypothetical protein